MFKRPYYNTVFKRLKEPRKFIHIISGPRQTGKTTLIQQVLKDLKIPSFYVSADGPASGFSSWIEQQWDNARLKLKNNPKKGFVLAIDEIQKVSNWSEVVKRMWDEDTAGSINLKVVLLGSSQLLIQKGLTESLAGRFEQLKISHWSYEEMKKAFGYSLEEYVFFGGYPGPADMITDESRWKQYVRDALVETAISKDILMTSRINKPALLKNLFELGCHYSGQILSLNKIIGQMQDAGNTTTLSHYLSLLESAGFLAGLQKYSKRKIVSKSSSPKFQVLNNALISSQMAMSFDEIIQSPDQWGRMVESSAGAHLLNITSSSDTDLFYWRERSMEVDFILARGDRLTAIEIKSGRKRESLPGMDIFSSKFNPERVLLVGKGGLELEDFLMMSVDDLMF